MIHYKHSHSWHLIGGIRVRRQERNRDYPRIEKILDDGTIIAYDKFNQLNTDLNINTLTDQQQHEVFGGILIRPQRNSNAYNERDYRREQLQQEEIESSKRKNKWLILLLFIVAIALVALIVKSCTGTNDKQVANDPNTSDPTNQNDAQLVQQKNEQLQQQVEDAKKSIENNQSDTQSKIDALKQEIASLKNNTDTQQANKVADEYNKTADNLQNAENERQNGNNDEMQRELDKVNSKLQEIKDKITEFLKKDK